MRFVLGSQDLTVLVFLCVTMWITLCTFFKNKCTNICTLDKSLYLYYVIKPTKNDKLNYFRRQCCRRR